jgi:hypothetical protein
MVDIELLGAPRELQDSALLDSGADVCAFPMEWMTRLGIEVESCDDDELETASGPGSQWTYQDAMLELVVRGQRIPVKGIFSETPVALLGRDDVFARFRITFDQKNERFRMEPYEDLPSREAPSGDSDC